MCWVSLRSTQPTCMRYKRVFLPGGSYFFTVKLANPSSHLLVDQIDHLRSAFTYVKRRHPFHIDAMIKGSETLKFRLYIIEVI